MNIALYSSYYNKINAGLNNINNKRYSLTSEPTIEPTSETSYFLDQTPSQSIKLDGITISKSVTFIESFISVKFVTHKLSYVSSNGYSYIHCDDVE